MYYWLAKWTKLILKQHIQRYPYLRGELCTNQCECAGTKNSTFTEEQVSRNCVFQQFCFFFFLGGGGKGIQVSINEGRGPSFIDTS